jgi:two-component system NarL family sensor kinase
MPAPPPFDDNALRRTERLRSEQQDDSPSFPGTVQLDADGRIRAASAGAAAMLGYEAMALAGRTLTELAADGWQEAAAVASARVRFGSTEDFALVLRGRSGRLSLIEMAPRPGARMPGTAGDFLLEWASGRVRREAAATVTDGQLRQLAYALMQRREGERLDVAKRLHDELSPTLAMVKYLVEDAAQRSAQGDRADASELLGQAAASLRHVVAELRNISNALRPRLLDDLGLLPALEWYCRGFEEAHPGVLMVPLLGAAERSVPEELKVDVFRVVQDALSNVARHAQATEVRVSLAEQDGELRLSIEDNGVGFDAEAALRAATGSVGLLTMRKRVRATGGRIALDSRPGRGTSVVAAWPTASGPGSSENGDRSYYPNRASEAPIRQ